MCGIFAYSGATPAAPQVFAGLRRLAYRGYDSWGVVVLELGKLQWKKAVGHVPDLASEPNLPQSSVALGHTRWATHGGVTDANAHPHVASDGSFALVHNGIVENAKQLQLKLIAEGFTFDSQTDSEVLVRLIESFVMQGRELHEAVRLVAQEAAGRNTFAILTKDGELLAVRNGSPLVVGRNSKTKTLVLSSDAVSLGALCAEMAVVDNGQLIAIRDSSITCSAVQTGKHSELIFSTQTHSSQDFNKAGYPHYMLKEIHESAQAIQAVLAQPQEKLEQLAKAITRAKTVYTIGSGTAGVAAAQMAFYLRTIANISAVSLIGAESQCFWPLFRKGDLIIAPSQSGETADVLEVLEHAQKKGVKIASYVNMAGSMMTQLSDFPFMAGAGPEVCVLSTKIFLSQLAWGYVLAQAVAGSYKQGIKQLRKTATEVEALLADMKLQRQLRTWAKELKKVPSLFLMGKGQLMEVAREGMVKIIEGSYIHAHAIPAGDLKHYAITLMQAGVPVLVLTANDSAITDIESAAHEVSARGARVFSIGSIALPMSAAHIELPDMGDVSALLTVIVLQLLAYYMAVEKGNPVDMPRNIAKSVTVK